MKATSIIALIIILGLGFVMSEKSKEKAKSQTNQKARDGFISLTKELGAGDFSNELIDWLEMKIRIQTGKDGLATYTNELKQLAIEDGKSSAIVQLALLKQRYLDEKRNVEDSMQWHKYVEAFRQMNKAQQKHEIERLRKVAEPDSEGDSNKLNLLELIHLGGDNKTTDVMVGGVKLFTLKEK